MKHSGIVLYFILIISFCFIITHTVLVLRSSSNFYSSPTHNLHGILSRRALSKHPIQHERGATKVLNATKHLPNQAAHKREEHIKGSSDGNDGEEEVIYHIDYHGVTTHPGPNPKHGKP